MHVSLLPWSGGAGQQIPYTRSSLQPGLDGPAESGLRALVSQTFWTDQLDIQITEMAKPNGHGLIAYAVQLSELGNLFIV